MYILAHLIPLALSLTVHSIQDRLDEVSKQVAKLKQRSQPATSVGPRPASSTPELADAADTRQLLKDVEEKLMNMDTSLQASSSDMSNVGGGASMVSEISAMRTSLGSQKVDINILKSTLAGAQSSLLNTVADLRTEIANVREGVLDQTNLSLAAMRKDISSLQVLSTQAQVSAKEDKPKYSADELNDKILNLQKAIDSMSMQQTTMATEVSKQSAEGQSLITQLTSTPDGQFTLAVAAVAVAAFVLAIKNYIITVKAASPAADGKTDDQDDQPDAESPPQAAAAAPAAADATAAPAQEAEEEEEEEEVV